MYFERMLEKDENVRFGMDAVDREIKRINLKTKSIFEGEVNFLT